MKRFCIGHIHKMHGLKGSMKVQMYFPYSHEILVNAPIYLGDELIEVGKVFGVVKNICVLQVKNVNSIEEAFLYKGSDIMAELDSFPIYSVHYIGCRVLRGVDYIGQVLDIHWTNGMEYLILDKLMISLDQVSCLKGNEVHLIYYN